MTTHRFDALAKSFSTRLSRRAAVQAAGLGLASSLAGSRVGGQDATPGSVAEERTFFLFVQTAGSGTFTANSAAGTPTVDGTPVAGGGAEYLLTLDGHPGGTIYFSDRPDRIFGEAPTGQFLDGLGFSPDNPPNAALVTQGEDGDDAIVILELLNPAWDEATGTVTYGATILDEYAGEGLAHVAARQQGAMLPNTFGRASLFIDDCADGSVVCWTDAAHIGETGGIAMCWHFGDVCCKPCDPSDESTASDRCNRTFAGCNGQCQGQLFHGCF